MVAMLASIAMSKDTGSWIAKVRWHLAGRRLKYEVALGGLGRTQDGLGPSRPECVPGRGHEAPKGVIALAAAKTLENKRDLATDRNCITTPHLRSKFGLPVPSRFWDESQEFGALEMVSGVVFRCLGSLKSHRRTCPAQTARKEQPLSETGLAIWLQGSLFSTPDMLASQTKVSAPSRK